MTDTSNDTPTKRCPQCGFECAPADALIYFTVNRAKKDGLSLKCRECSKAYQAQYRAKYPERMRQYKLSYLEKNPDRGIERLRKWEKENPERKKESDRRYREKNREKVLARRKIQYQTRKEYKKEQARTRWRLMSPEGRNVVLGQAREWRNRNADKIRIYSHKRRSGCSFSPETWNGAHMEYAVTHFNLTCAYCGQQMYDLFGNVIQHWDHYQPVSKGGSTRYDNMLPTCSACNLSKNASLPLEWMCRRFGKRKASAIDKRIQEYFEAVRNAFPAQ